MTVEITAITKTRKQINKTIKLPPVQAGKLDGEQKRI